MTLIVTSAWVEFPRDTGWPTCDHVEELLGSETAICNAVRMEVLADARNKPNPCGPRRLIVRATDLPLRPLHYEGASALFRLSRLEGATVRKLIDDLIAAIALDSGVADLHHNADVDVLARHAVSG